MRAGVVRPSIHVSDGRKVAVGDWLGEVSHLDGDRCPGSQTSNGLVDLDLSPVDTLDLGEVRELRSLQHHVRFHVCRVGQIQRSGGIAKRCRKSVNYGL